MRLSWSGSPRHQSARHPRWFARALPSPLQTIHLDICQESTQRRVGLDTEAGTYAGLILGTLLPNTESSSELPP
jgi:hypothetical protein